VAQVCWFCLTVGVTSFIHEQPLRHLLQATWANGTIYCCVLASPLDGDSCILHAYVLHGSSNYTRSAAEFFLLNLQAGLVRDSTAPLCPYYVQSITHACRNLSPGLYSPEWHLRSVFPSDSGRSYGILISTGYLYLPGALTRKDSQAKEA
jgi:hypothetical protein